MSHPSSRANREEILNRRKETKRAQKALRKRLAEEGLQQPAHNTTSNGKSQYTSRAEEEIARHEASCGQLGVLRNHLPELLRRFEKIKDPRNTNRITHKISLLMLYGLLSFVLQISSSREATREMSRPTFWDNLKHFFPELETTPHHETLKRLLAEIDISEIENIHLDLIRRWIKNKKFRRYLVDNCYPISIDGTQKMCREDLWADECLERTFNRGKDNEHTQYYVYVLQASLSFPGGLSIPVMCEFLTYEGNGIEDNKQDCELKAFHRSATRCRVEDCLAEPRKALTRPRIPLRVSYGGVLSWCIHAGTKPSGQCTESRRCRREGRRPRGDRPPGSLDLGEG
ncbi:MAG: transposase family protein [bacterium]